jgi:aerobic-type carbon monoxide dehydrogenase small subunit (CoxS/CutS family)
VTEERRLISLTVNGEERSVDVEPRTLLSDLLRHHLGLTGTHVGCEQGSCGACTVLVDGRAVRSCLMLAPQVEGAEVRTVEGLTNGLPDGALHPFQQAMHELHGLQCGFCTPGIVVSLAAALDQGAPVEDAEREVLEGHLCRCTGYVNIRRAVRAAWAARASEPGR